MPAPELATFTHQQLLDIWDKLSPAQREALRKRAQSDLWFFAKCVLNYKDMVPHVHQAMCDLFIKKDTDKGIFEQDEIKERFLASPRGCFKSSMDCADICQWIVCFPDITILILSGTQDLAAKMVHEVRGHFIGNDLLRKMFPECCLSPKDKLRREVYQNPARKLIKREPTLEISTVDSIKAGSHYDLIKGDDVVHEKNSSTIDQLMKAKEAIDATRFLLNPGGYFDFIGTRYHAADAYGQLLAFSTNSEDGPVMKTLIQAAWTIKPGAKPEVNPDTGWPMIKEEDVNLLFPERLPFKHLIKSYKRNPSQFCCQLLNDPSSSTQTQFDLAALQRHTVPFAQVPIDGVTYVQWDFAGSNPDPRNDRTVGVVGVVDKRNRLFIIDMMAGRFPPNQKAGAVVELAQRWSPAMTYFEDSFGAKDLEPTIIATAQQLKVMFPSKWLAAPRAKNSKINRIAFLNQLLAEDRLFFVADLAHLEDLYQEFIDFPNGRHDDIPDAIAQLVRNVLQIGGLPIPESPKKTQAELRAEFLLKQIVGSDEELPHLVPTEDFSQVGPLGFGY